MSLAVVVVAVIDSESSVAPDEVGAAGCVSEASLELFLRPSSLDSVFLPVELELSRLTPLMEAGRDLLSCAWTRGDGGALAF